MKQETLHEALDRLGFSSLKPSEGAPNVNGRRLVFNEMTGTEVGLLSAQEGWAFVHELEADQ